MLLLIVHDCLLLLTPSQTQAASSAGLDFADIVEASGVPLAKTKQLDFESFAIDSPQLPDVTNMEHVVWAIAKILFDDYEDEYSEGIPEIQRSDFEQRIKKDRLTFYWSQMISKTPNFEQSQYSSDRTDSAIAALAAGSIPRAILALQLDGNYHLATLVAQIDKADKTFRDQIKAQIQSWDKQNMLSEMPENVRAVYEILAGNTTIPTCRETGPLEDRVSKFGISKRIEMNWMQAFGLCLWYAIHEDQPIEAAVADFQAKLDSGDETAFPHPYRWTSEHAEPEQGEDPLWVLLKLYASMKRSQDNEKNQKVDDSAPVLPQDLLPAQAGGEPFDHRFVFQIYHALAARVPSLKTDSECADRLALDYSFQLSATGDLIGAAFALLHLTNEVAREAHIKDLLARHAAHLDEPQPSPDHRSPSALPWTTMVQGLKIPEAWLFEAKALYAKALGNNLKEVNYLLRASEWDSAHEALCRTVAPRLILDRDYKTLRASLKPFLQLDKPGETFYNWHIGGAVYTDFLEIVEPSTKQAAVKGGNKEYKIRLHRLHGALVKLGGHLKGDKVSGLEERVAIKEISRIVAESLADEKDVSPFVLVS